MAIVTATTFQEATGQTITGSDLTALSTICVAVDAAIRQMIHPFVPEPTTYTSIVMDAPLGNVLILPAVPVRAITSIYLRYDANGDSSLFTSDYLLTNYTDYYMPSDPVLGYNRSGFVYRRGMSVWGYESRRPLGRLSAAYEPNRGAILATWSAGLSSLPADVAMAGVLAAGLIYDRRKTGMPFASESWNGRSQSVASSFLTAAIDSPDVQALLADCIDPVRVGGL